MANQVTIVKALQQQAKGNGERQVGERFPNESLAPQLVVTPTQTTPVAMPSDTKHTSATAGTSQGMSTNVDTDPQGVSDPASD